MKRTTILSLVLLTFVSCRQGPAETPHEQAPSPGIAAADTLPENGPAKINGPDGRVKMEGDMRNGKRHGLWTSYHPGGAVQSRTDYVDGVQEGASVVFHPNGQTYYTGDYHHGHEVGEWRFFDEQGALVRTVRYDSTGAVINDR